jgi:hypothetical protein
VFSSSGGPSSAATLYWSVLVSSSIRLLPFVSSPSHTDQRRPPHLSKALTSFSLWFVLSFIPDLVSRPGCPPDTDRFFHVPVYRPSQTPTAVSTSQRCMSPVHGGISSVAVMGKYGDFKQRSHHKTRHGLLEIVNTVYIFGRGNSVFHADNRLIATEG